MKSLVLVLLSLLVLNSACSKREAPAAHQGGSSDGGGNVVGSRLEDVEAAVKTVRVDLKNLFHRAAVWGKNPASAVLPQGDLHDLMLDPKIPMLIDAMEIQLQPGPCSSSDPTHIDGSANPQLRKICLSSDRLQRVGPTDILRRQVLALAAHEVAHLMGKDEFMANWVQQWVINYPFISDVWSEKPPMETIFALLVAYQNLVDATSAIEAGLPQIQLCRLTVRANTRLNKLRNDFPGYPRSLFEHLDDFPFGFVNEENAICSADAAPTPAVLQEFVELATAARAALKQAAQNVSDYDSIEGRSQQWVNLLK